MNGVATFENVRRYRVIASLYRQTAAFRPNQKWSLLGQAKEWERRALLKVENYSSFPVQCSAAKACAVSNALNA